MLRTELIRPLPQTLTEHADRLGKKIAFADSRRQVSYFELELRTRNIAGHLAGLGVHPGDRAAIYLGNCVEMVESYLALTRANVIGVPLNPHSTDPELEYYLSDSGARVVITDVAHVEQLRRVLGDAEHPRIIVTGDKRLPAGTVPFETLATTESEAGARDDLGLDDVAWMLYTSGTTGKPKGVLSTQRNCLWSVAACYVPVPELSAEDRVLWPLPLFHSLSHIACVLAVTSVGATARITDGYSADEILSVLREESPTFIAGVPTMYHYLLQAAQQQGVRAPDLRVGLVGGAVTTQSLRTAFQETFGVPLLDAYGSTETCGSITINWPTGARVEGSSGLPVPGLNVRLVDPETGNDVPTGEEGEVWVSGPNVMVGYHNWPEETARALRGGWYRTGDLAHRDDAGYFTVTGRIKDLIIRGGENIHPAEIEDVLRGVPGVADVAVAGKAHEVLGEVPVAFLVPGPEGLDTDALFAACRERLSYFKVPEELYEVTQIPRTGSGKVTRRLLLGLPARLRAAGSSSYEHLFRADWLPLPPAETALPGSSDDSVAQRWVLAGETDADLVACLESAGAELTRVADPLPAAGIEPTDVVVLPVDSPDSDPSALVADVASRVRAWLGDGQLSPARLVVLTRGGVRVGPAETLDLAHAAVAGLVRGLRPEYGDRLVHVDLDASAAAGDPLPQNLLPALSAGDEPQLAMRAGGVVRPSLERLPVRSGGDGVFGPGRTVVVTGADTATGAVMARHLVAGHGVRHMVLISDQGNGDLAVADLAAELTALKAAVSVAACDITDRAALHEVLAGLRRPLAGVFHAASGPVRYAVEAVTALHEVTARTEAATLVLLSSAAGQLEMPHEPEDAAVAAFCDAIALRRRDQGRPALSLSLGPWADDADLALSAPTLPAGVGTLSRRELLAMVDAALLSGEAAASPLKLDAMTLHGGSVPAALRGLIDTSPGAAADAGRAEEFRAELAVLPEAEQLRVLVSTVCGAAAEIGGGNGGGPEPRRAFKEIGFSSLQAVLLRNRLVEITGLRLPTTLAFDYPTPQAVARFLLDELSGDPEEQARTTPDRPAGDDPVVLVSMACRLPGGIASPEDLWTFVDQGLDGITAFPADRGWDVKGIYDPDPEQAGKTYVREGGFLQDATGFDADFFRISPREALAMDPQQRMFLESAWELFERAGIDVTTLHGSRTGVFAGAMNQEYGLSLANSADETEGYQSTGTAASVVSGRVAYTFGFEGPAVTVDTACSSSLVALHLAAQSLRSGECDLALAGGVAVMAQPTSFVEFSRQRGLAADARCKAFAAAADGTGWSEGVALVLLERLSDARRNGHTVLAVVQGSAVNQDGASNGLTAPNGPSQQRVIRQALTNARLQPADIDLVEAHGTGTTLGDPIEAQALINTYGRHHNPDQPLWLGSLKSNIGHTQAAAGVAGVIKSVLAMHHGTMPQSLHIDTPTPHVDWSEQTVQLLTQSRSWPDTGHPRRTAVSAFGVSGTNAHVILEEAPAEEPAEPAAEPVTEEPATGTVVPWTLSAATPAALADSAQRLIDHLDQHPDLTPTHIAAHLTRRPLLEHRAVITGSQRHDMIRALTALAHHTTDPALTTNTPTTNGKIAFAFPGQGSQWAGMGARLLDTHPAFTDTITACDNALAPYQDWTVTDVLRQTPNSPTLDRVDVVQPVTFAVMTALARLWQHHGIHPDAVIGHSQGEIAAAHIAGALTLDDAARIIALRSQAIARQLAGHGAMMAIPLPHDQIPTWTAPHGNHIDIATINGPTHTVVAGDPTAIDTLHTTLNNHHIKARKIPVDYASHTSHVEQLHHELTHLLADITPQTPTIPIYSTTDTTWITGPHLTGDYWYRNLRQTVHFHTATTTLADTGHHTIIEISPHPTLTPAIEDTLNQTLPNTPTTTIPTLRRNQHEPTTFHTALAHLHTHTNHPHTWHLPTTPTNPTNPLPTYPFQHQRYWPEPAAAASASADPYEARFWEAVDQEDVAALATTLDVTGERDRDLVASALPTLTNWRRRTRQKSVMESWRYRVVWRRLGVVNSDRLSGKWLAVVPEGFSDDARVTTTLGALRSYGADCVVLEAGDAERSALADRFAAEGVAEAGYSGLLSFLSLDERPHAVFPAVSNGLMLLAALVPALADCGVAAPLWSLTMGGADGDGGDDLRISPSDALTWGFGRVAALEYPKLWGGLVDLPAEPGERVLRYLTGVLRGQGDEDQVTIRSSGVSGRRLVRAPLDGTAERRQWTPRGTVLVTGGTGGVGGQVARWLASAGADHLLLVSRRGAGAEGVRELVTELEGLGTTVTVAECDVADRDALAAVVEAVPDDKPLSAVVHAAGLGQQSTIGETSPEEFARIVEGKVLGARNLDEVLGDRPLDAFVLISSNAGVWGGGGQGAYAAANAYLDALAVRRRGLGRTATSIAWGSWAGAGLGAVDGAAERLSRLGIEAMDPELALQALVHAVERDEATVSIADIDWSRFAPGFTAARSSALLGELPEVQAVLRELDSAASGERSGSDLAGRLAALPEADREPAVLDAVRARAATVLGHRDSTGVDADTAFTDQGFDSMTAVQLRNALVKDFHLRLPTTLLFDYPTPRGLARFVLGELSGVAADEAQTVAGNRTDDDPVVLVGMACRLPGGIASPQDLWELLASGGEALSDFPTDRGWDIEALYDPEPGLPGKTYTRRGGFLEGAADFDASFFKISPREALAMDPQHRVLLESSWELFERAGVDVTALRGSRTGVFAGGFHTGYTIGADLIGEGVDGYTSHNNLPSVLSGRVAYTFGFEGPAVTVDTACSSSLVALHLAAQSLRSGECDLALAGGVAVMPRPSTFVEFSRQRGLAADGRCKAFAAAADGTGWSEGVALVLLERLSDARRSGHTVLAVVRGSAVNQDGASNGLTAPNGPSQQRVIRQALSNARLQPRDVDLVEAHGTGTVLGDPIEAQAVISTYGQEREPGQPLWLGSLKSNIGHTQAAAGMAGVIKSVLSMHHGTMPQTLHIDAPTPHVDWSAGDVRLVTEAAPWPDTGRARRVAVSAFGVSGTNAHVILEEAPAEEPAEPAAEPVTEEPATGTVVPWTLSAATPAALADSAQRLIDHLDQHPDLTPTHIAAHLTRRPLLEHRAVITGSQRHDMIRALTALAHHTTDPALTTNTPTTNGKIAFAFPGQGSQWAGMGARLLDTHPAFTDTITACDNALAPYQDWTVTDVLRQTPNSPTLDRVDVVQPVTFAVMTALARLWQHHGIHPDAVIGHSQGEIAAAHIAGALTLDDAARIIALRSQAIARQLAGHGAMMAIPLPHDQIPTWTAPHGNHIDIATINGPTHTVVAGDPTAIDTLHTTLNNHHIKARKIPVDYASHTSHVEQLHHELTHLLADITPQTPTIPIYSTTDTTWITGPHLTGDYWYRNLRQTVHFHTATTTLADTGHHTIIEISPHPTLTPAIEDTLNQTLPNTPTTTIPTLRRNQHEPTTFHTALAHLHTHTNHPHTWHLPTTPTNPTNPLPTYPFQHQRYWLKTDGKVTDIGAVGLDGSGHPLLGAVVRLPESDGAVFTNRLSLRTQPWLTEHSVSGTVLVPGTALLELVVRAGDELGATVVSELVVETPLALPASGGVQLRVSVGETDESGLRPVTVHSRADDADADAVWTRHVTGHLSTATAPRPSAGPAVWPPTGAQPVPVADFYADQHAAGFEFGPMFQGLREVWTRGDEVFAEVGLPDDADLSTSFLLHPALLDSALHAAAFLPGRQGGDAPARLPFAWNEVALHAVGATALRVHIRPVGGDDIAVEVTDPTGAPVASVGRLVTRQVDLRRIGAPSGVADMLFATQWSELAVDGPGDRSEPVPGEVLDLTRTDHSPQDPPRRSRALVTRALEVIQAHLRDPEPGAPLVVLTGDARHDPAMASVWGLVRVAQSENPGQVILIDVDGTEASRRALPAAVATGEPQLAVRDGAVSVPRLKPSRPAEAGAAALDPDGTVLVTGGTGTLGGLVARRLITEHGVRHLLLTSRRGPDAPQARRLAEELTALGAAVTITACDIGDHKAVAELVAGVPAEHPLTAVIHSAAVLADGVFTSLDPAGVDTVFEPKVDGAWNLHLATEDLGLAAFVLFSSASGTLGNAGQGNYAAGNGFLDGLAAYRRQRGLPGLSLAWGLWEQASEMTGALLDGTRGHLKQDVAAMSDEEGLRLFDAAMHGVGAPDIPSVLVPVKLSLAALRESVNPPAVLRDLVPRTRPTARQGAVETSDSFLDQLRRITSPEQSKKLLDMVLSHTAATLGHTGTGAVDERQAFKDLGFDSLAAVDLRNRIAATTGLRLPATLVFDYPTPAALARQVGEELGLGGGDEATAQALAELHRLETSLDELLLEPDDRAEIADRLRKLAARWHTPAGATEPDLELATDEEILRLAEAELDLP
ncbi:type I polyketide synthase [Streptomyces bauhiniae]